MPAATAGAVPPGWAGPGSIALRQSTFWGLRTETGAVVRVHFTGKRELRFTGSGYEGVALVDEHPLLAGVGLRHERQGMRRRLRRGALRAR